METKSHCHQIGLRIIAAFICMILMPTITVSAINVSGNVKVSSLDNKAELTLTGATVINVDVDKTIKSISGDYPLVIQGNGCLTIDSKGHGISVNSLRTSVNLVITSKKDGLNIDQDIVIEKGNVSIDCKGDGIYSRHGDVEIISGYTISSCGTNHNAINANEGDITFHSGAVVDAIGAKLAINTENGTFNSEAKVKATAGGWAIWAKSVNIKGGSLYAKSSAFTITASTGDVFINADVEAISTYSDCMGIRAKNNVIIQGGKVFASCSTNGTAVKATNGNIEVRGGNLEASGAKYGLYAGAQIIISADVSVSGFWAFWAQKITIKDPHIIMAPMNGMVGENTIFDASGNWANRVIIGTRPLNGSVSIDSSSPTPGTYMNYRLGGEIYQLYQNGTKLNVVWQRSKDGETGWTDQSVEKTYVVQNNDYDYYIRVKVSAEGYEGALYSTPRKVTKQNCYIDVVAPELLISNDKIVVANAKNTQEYIIFNYQKQLSSITESDWENSIKPEYNGQVSLEGTKNNVNYVYTRVRETAWMFAGTDLRTASRFFGETTYFQDIQLTVKKVNGVSSPTSENELEEESRTLYTAVSTSSDRLRITASPIPENATNFSGVRGNYWLMNGHGIESEHYGEYGKFYADFKCTEEIKTDQYYKTVYVKLTKPTNSLEIVAEYYKGYNDLIHRSLRFYVADANGDIQINNINVKWPLIVGKGEKLEGLEMSVYPKKGTLKTLSTTTTDASSPGTAPVIIFNKESMTIDVDATKADLGTFFYNIYNDHIRVGSFSVKVSESIVEDVIVSPESITGEPGEQYQLTATIVPADAEGDVAWVSSDTNVATVTSTGLVTVKDNAEIGATTTITASVNGKKGQCLLTVGGEIFNLYVAGIQVTTRNMDKLAELISEKSDASMERYLSGSMEVSFDGVRTLTLKNATIDVGDGTAQGMSFGVKGLIVQVEGDCRVNSNNYNGIKVMMGATITGNGRLTVSGGDCGIAYKDGKESPITLSLDGITLNTTGGNYGIHGGVSDNKNRLDIDNSDIVAEGQTSAVSSWYGGIELTDAVIVEPESAYVIKGQITSGGSPATKVVIKAEGGKKGDVNRDGRVDISDVVATINTIAGDNTYKATADVNEDNSVNISDIVLIINIIAGIQ